MKSSFIGDLRDYDIMLGYLPLINHLVRNPNNKHYFATFTSGFTAVTNAYMLELLNDLKNLLGYEDFRSMFLISLF